MLRLTEKSRPRPVSQNSAASDRNPVPLGRNPVARLQSGSGLQRPGVGDQYIEVDVLLGESDYRTANGLPSTGQAPPE